MSLRITRIIPALALAVATVFVLPYGGMARADSSVLSNQLILSNPATGAAAQMMPTTAWLAQHPTTSGSGSGSTTTTTSSGTLPSPTCTLGTDSSPDDAHVLVNNDSTQYDSLDLSAFGLSSDSTNVTGQVSVENLGNGTPAGAPATPQVAGGADVWYLVWNYGSDPSIKGYFLEAEYPGTPADIGYVNNSSTSNLPVDLSWGEIVVSATGGQQFKRIGPATGSFDVPNNRITIAAPLSVVGGAQTGETLSSPHAVGDAVVGTSVSGGLLETADQLDSSSDDYHVGQAGTNCPAPRTSSPSSGLPTAGTSNNLSYYGGPVVHSIQNHIIWWLPKAGTLTYSDGSACAEPGTSSYSYEQPASGTATVGALPGGPGGDVDYETIIKQYFADLSGTAFYNLLGQYADTATGITPNSVSLGASWTDNCGYTSTPSTTTGPVPGGTQAAPIYQTDIQAEVQKAIQVNHWPDGLGNEYFVYTGYGAADCFAPPGPAGLVPACSIAGPDPVYCAYHGDFQDASGNYVLYANMADGAFSANPTTINLCYESPIGTNDPTHTVNGVPVKDPIADAEVSITSHEQYETVTDAEVGTAQQYAPPLAWYEFVNGEIGDKCAYNYGSYAADGSNINLHGDHYIVQEEYSNWNNGCALTSYQGNGGYGGYSSAVPIQKGTTLIGVPVSGITSTSQLASSLMGPGQLPAGSITQIQLYHKGAYQTYTPGKGKALPLARTDGILVTSTVAGTWKPAGTLYTSAPTIQLNPGWNLVSATYPNPGLMTDTIYSQIAAETGACTVGVLSNEACSPTITEIRTVGAGGQTIDWKPAPADATGNATWPQTYGNQVPFTSGMWIYSTKALTWTVQGNQCQTVDSSGVCH